MLDAMPWVLIVSIWLNDPPQIIPVHTQVYSNYDACMKARDLWDHKKFVAICGVKLNK